MAIGTRKLLTEKQINFCRGIVEGKSLYESFITSYKPNKDKQTNYKKASELYKQGNIQEYIAKLRAEVNKEVIKKAVWNKERAEKELLDLMNVTKENLFQLSQDGNNQYFNASSVNSIVNIAKELNKLNDLYPESNSQEINIQNNILNATRVNKYSKADIEKELKDRGINIEQL